MCKCVRVYLYVCVCVCVCVCVQYARADEVDKLRTDYQEGISTLKLFLDVTNQKMTAAVQVSFLNVRTFVQDVEVLLGLQGVTHNHSHTNTLTTRVVSVVMFKGCTL